MSETIDLNQIYQRYTVKSRMLGSGVFCVTGSMLNLLALYDYSKLSSKVDDDVKGMLPGFFFAIVGNVIFWPFFLFLLIKLPNRTFYKILSIFLMISCLFGCIVMMGFFFYPERLGAFGEDLVKREKYYPAGYLGSEISMVFNAATFGGFGWMFFRISFFNPAPPPPRPVRVVRRRRSVQKNVVGGGEEGDDDSSE